MACFFFAACESSREPPPSDRAFFSRPFPRASFRSPSTLLLPFHSQVEKAFQKQLGVNLLAKGKGAKKPGKGGSRFVRSVGLGFKTPKEAAEGIYIDKKCPFVGDVSIRGRILTGTVKSAKMNRTIIVRRDYLHFIKKYQRYEKRHANVAGEFERRESWWCFFFFWARGWRF